MSLESILATLPSGGFRGRGTGKTAPPLLADYGRDLTAEDIVRTQTEPSPNAAAVPLKQIRAQHHTIARLLAQGLALEEISIQTGFSPSRISTLRDDPQFSELLAYYTGIERAGYERHRADMHERLAELGFTSVEMLHEQLLDNPERFETKPELLLSIITAVSDRTGHGKSSNVQHSHSFALDERQLAILRSAQDTPAQLAEEDRGTLLSMARDAAGTFCQEARSNGGAAGGPAVREEGPEGAGDGDGLDPATTAVD